VRHCADAPDTNVAWQLRTTESALVASRDYLERRGTPRDPQSLGAHACLHYPRGRDEVVWSLERGAAASPAYERVSVEVSGPLSANNSEALRTAAATGLGIALIPDFSAEPMLRSGALQRVLPAWRPPALSRTRSTRCDPIRPRFRALWKCSLPFSTTASAAHSAWFDKTIPRLRKPLSKYSEISRLSLSAGPLVIASMADSLNLQSTTARRKDSALLQGQGCFVGDLILPGMLDAAFVRSPYSHAHVVEVHTHTAAAAAGVVTLLTARDFPRLLAPSVNGLLPGMYADEEPLLSTTHVRSVGEPVTLVLAQTAAQENANVVAALALAVGDPDAVEVELMADPEARTNSHHVEARGDGGAIRLSVENLPMPANPKTSRLTAYSIPDAIAMQPGAEAR